MNLRYNIHLLVRVTLLALFMAVFLYAIQQYRWYVTSTVSGLFSVLMIIELLRYTNRSERQLANFLLSLKQKDFTGPYSVKPLKKNFLNEAFYEISQEFSNVRIDKEAHYHLLNTIVEHIKSALISYDEEGKIGFFNSSARNLLGVKHIRFLEELKDVDPKLYNAFNDIYPGKPILLELRTSGENLKLSVSAVEFRMKNKLMTLITLQDIRSELDEQELQSWKKLIKILRHEIMNSVTPISSLSAASNKLLEEDVLLEVDKAIIDRDSFEDLSGSIATIERRSKGLLKFVDAYRNLTKIPDPVMKEFSLVDMVNHVINLLQPEFSGVDIQKDVSGDLVLNADRELLEQVLINIMLNARESLKQKADPYIRLSARNDMAEIFLMVKDNGCGMDEETLSQAFIPFFTTKANGSGIGLSLSRQIVQMHRGRIEIFSAEDDGTEVMIRI